MNFSKEEKTFLFLSGIFVALLVISNIIATKVIMIGGLVGPAAVVFYGLTFALSDTLTEIWGKDRVKFVIKLGFVASVISAIMIQLAIMLPSAPFWTNQEAYQLILGSSIRIVVASMVAYLVSQFHDVWAFHFWKKLTKGKYLWIRNNLSTAVSQLIDTVIFITIAFYGTGSPIISMIIGQYTIKLIVAVFDTPLVYLGVNLVKKAISKDESIDNVEYKLS